MYYAGTASCIKNRYSSTVRFRNWQTQFCSAEKYTKRLIKLHEGILRTYRNARDLNGQLANLRDELSDQKEKLKQSGTQSFEDANLIQNYKKELAKVVW